jgi:hypothetical protein
LYLYGIKINKTEMKIFRNTLAVRNGETTVNVFFHGEAAPAPHWVECSELEIYRKGCTLLWKSGGTSLFGWL